MDAIELRPVLTDKERNIFLTFPWKIYKNDQLWVPPLLPERKKVIDPVRGAFFQRGYAEFFIAWRGGVPVGTICVAVDEKANENREWDDCMFGFFEVIEDYAVAEAMLDFASSWAAERGMDKLFGPFNLDNEDGYGILLEGRDRPPVMLCGHTPTYYQDFVERYGFEPGRPANLAYAFDLEEDNESLRRLSRGAARISSQGRFRVRHADFDRWDEEVEHAFILINQALAHLDDHVPWQREAFEALLKPFANIADPELILFVNDGDQTVGFFPGVPNLNEAFIHANGLRRPWDYLKLMWHMRKQTACLAVKSVLVLPEYWGTGVSLILFDEMVKRAREKGHKWIDLSLTSEDNPKTPMLAERFGARVYKRYQVYRKEV